MKRKKDAEQSLVQATSGSEGVKSVLTGIKPVKIIVADSKAKSSDPTIQYLVKT